MNNPELVSPDLQFVHGQLSALTAVIAVLVRQQANPVDVLSRAKAATDTLQELVLALPVSDRYIDGAAHTSALLRQIVLSSPA